MLDPQKALVLWQEPGSVVRRRWRATVAFDGQLFTARRGDDPPKISISTSEIDSVQVVRALRMRKAYYRPFRGEVLRLEVNTPGGLLVVGVALRDPEPWNAAISRSLTPGPRTPR